MKTVGEFKNAGLEFVEGDVVDDNFNNDGSEMKPLKYWMVEHCNTGRYNYDHAKVESFSWRENTGVKPEFNGLVDAIIGGKTYDEWTDVHVDFLSWELGHDCPTVKWRPSLNRPQQWPENSRIDIIGQNGNDGLHYDNTAQQVESLAVNDKPIFTQAMADAGKKVKVGMEFSTATGNYVDLLVNENTVVFEHEELGFVVENNIFIHPVDTRTDREKAIDAMECKISEMVQVVSVEHTKIVIAAMIDSGLVEC